MPAYDLYGSFLDDFEKAKNILEPALGVRFELRESGYQGGRYFKCETANCENFVLKRNVDPIDSEPSEISFPLHHILFYVNDTARSGYWQKRMAQAASGFVLLRHENLA